jgi:hypothetical protein
VQVEIKEKSLQRIKLKATTNAKTLGKKIVNWCLVHTSKISSQWIVCGTE